MALKTYCTTMRILHLLSIAFVCQLMISCQGNTQEEKWKQQAKRVTIIRDEYGIPHIYGKTDADCVFGLMYAQCEEDFKRVEHNYLTMLGRTAEARGVSELYEDLLLRLTVDSAEAKEDYSTAPEWLRKLLDAHADGINYYLYKHPEVKPEVLSRFEPWFPLMYTDGSISALQTGGLEANDVKSFYESKSLAKLPTQKLVNEDKLIGSNGFAISPSKSRTGNALFYINPHVTFYFRPEVHLQSEEGLHVYGAVTWGQFFIYQGFNEFCGFMHTSSSADVADLYAETIIKGEDGKNYYRYNDSLKPVTEKKISISYKEGNVLKSKSFTTYATHHGPVLAMYDGKWLSLKTSNRSLKGLVQSWERTKANSFESFRKNFAIAANPSNNTVYADAAGNIAYWHGNYMPKRDSTFNWNDPVDGSSSKTEWTGMHTPNEIVHIINPANGWIQNTNNTPYSVSGPASPARKNFPVYMAPDGENFRGLQAVKLLSNKNMFSLDDLIAVGYDPHLAAFDTSLPVLFSAYERISKTDSSLYRSLAEPVAELKAWDRNSSVSSVATTLAIHWAEKMNVILRTEDPELFSDYTTKYGTLLRNVPAIKLITALQEVVDKLKGDFGKWQVAWGDVNRLQRIKSSIAPIHADSLPSFPVGRASSTWGQLASYNSQYVNGSAKRYGFGGNSFVCAVEFGKKIRARAILAGGQSGDASSPHFFDQAKMYADGQFRDVNFYKEDVLKHAKRTYHPGENSQ
jgi:acyl-homoserine-lactone acylase